MKRNEFLRTSSTFVAGSVLLPTLSCRPDPGKPPVPDTPGITRTNWAANYVYKAPNLHRPGSVAELQELVARLGSQKALGSRHCFNDIADSPLNQISTENLNRVVSIDRSTQQVTVESGMRYGDLAPQLEREGLALHNLASLPHISIAGACATATHGSGVGNGNLASPLLAFDLITPDGQAVTLTRQDPEFYGAAVHLGALGVVSRLTLQAQDTYQVAQRVFLDLPLEEAVGHFDAIMSAGYSVSLFTDWMDQKVSQVWVKSRPGTDREITTADFYGARAADRDVHPIISLGAENCTPQMGLPGPWFERLPHFKMGFMPSSGEELQAEFFVPRENAPDVLQAIERQKDRIFPHLHISEIRSVAADDFWLSPASGRDVVAFHFTWKRHPEEVPALIRLIERELDPFGLVPHWGKLFSLDPALLHKRYPRMNDFIALARKFDPAGKLKNAYLDLNLFG